MSRIRTRTVSYVNTHCTRSSCKVEFSVSICVSDAGSYHSICVSSTRTVVLSSQFSPSILSFLHILSRRWSQYTLNTSSCLFSVSFSPHFAWFRYHVLYFLPLVNYCGCCRHHCVFLPALSVLFLCGVHWDLVVDWMSCCIPCIYVTHLGLGNILWLVVVRFWPEVFNCVCASVPCLLEDFVIPLRLWVSLVPHFEPPCILVTKHRHYFFYRV